MGWGLGGKGGGRGLQIEWDIGMGGKRWVGRRVGDEGFEWSR